MGGAHSTFHCTVSLQIQAMILQTASEPGAHEYRLAPFQSARLFPSLIGLPFIYIYCKRYWISVSHVECMKPPIPVRRGEQSERSEICSLNLPTEWRWGELSIPRDERKSLAMPSGLRTQSSLGLGNSHRHHLAFSLRTQPRDKPARGVTGSWGTSHRFLEGDSP